MANTLRFKRGLLAGLPSAAVGEPLFTTDTFDLYIGTASGTQKYQKFIASGTTSQLLRGDGSLLTMPIVLSSPANGEVLKYNGTNWVNSSDAGITGSGVAGQVAYFTGATTQGGSNNLFWDASNSRLGIGTNTPSWSLDISTAGATISRMRGGSANNQGAAYFVTQGGSNTSLLAIGDGSTMVGGAVNNAMIYVNGSPLSFSMGGTTQMTLTSVGRLLLGSTSDNGLRFQVTGDGSFSGYVTAASFIPSGSTAPTNGMYLGAANQLNFATNSVNRFRINSSGFSIFSTNVMVDRNYNYIFDNLDNADNGAIVWRNADATRTTSAQITSVSDGTFARKGIGFFTKDVADWTTAATQKMLLNASGNLGLGVTPSAWGSVSKAIQMGAFASVFGSSSNFGGLATNRYNDNANNRYIGTGASALYEQGNGIHYWYNAPSGTAGNVISYTQAMTLFSTGNLAVGTTTDSGFRADINGTMRVSGASTFTITGNNIATFESTNANGGYITLRRSGTDFMYIGNSTAVGAGANNVDIYATTGNGIRLFTNSNIGAALTIATTNAATFSSSVTATSALISNYRLELPNMNIGYWDSTNNRFESTTRPMFFTSYGSGNNIYFGFDGSYGAMTLHRATSNTHIGGTTDTGEKLQVTGTMRVSGIATYGSTGGSGLRVYGAAGTNQWDMYLNGANIRFSDNTGTGSFVVDRPATFSSSVTAASFIPTSNTIPTNGLYLSGTNTIAFSTNTTQRLNIDATGIATFTNSVTATGSILVSNTINAYAYQNFGANSSYGWQIGKADNSGLLAPSNGFYIYDLVNNITRFSIASTGAATFSSSVTLSGNLTVDTNTFFVDSSANRVGVKQSSPTSSLHVDGSNARSYVTKTANYTMTENDYTVLCDTTSGGFTITLPAASGCAGRIYCIKKTIGNSGVNNVTIDGNASETIDGLTTISLQCRSSVIIQSDGSNWWVLAEKNDASCI